MVMNSVLTIRLVSMEEDIAKIKGAIDISLRRYNSASEEFLFFKEYLNEEFHRTQSLFLSLFYLSDFSNLFLLPWDPWVSLWIGG